MGVRKTYQAVGFKTLDFYEMVNGAKALIQFRSGNHAPDSKGQYTTENPDVIEALDNSSAYGISFKCIRTEKTAGPDLATSKAKTAPKPPAPPADNEGVGAGNKGGEPGVGDGADAGGNAGDGFTNVPDIATVQAARDYLVKNCGATASKLPNGPAVKRFAAEKKINFVDLA